MADNNASTGGGIGFVGLLTILFIALKLTNVITWSWWWILSPLWISFGLSVGFIIIFFGGVFLLEHINDSNWSIERRRKKNKKLQDKEKKKRDKMSEKKWISE